MQPLKPVSSEALEDYVARNRQSIMLGKEFKLKIDYRIVPYVEIEKLFSDIDLDNAWKPFYSKYPASGGYIRLSRVGFNKAKDQAIVSTAWWPSLCAAKVTMCCSPGRTDRGKCRRK